MVLEKWLDLRKFTNIHFFQISSIRRGQDSFSMKKSWRVTEKFLSLDALILGAKLDKISINGFLNK